MDNASCHRNQEVKDFIMKIYDFVKKIIDFLISLNINL
jgi:uncharacterized protein YpuA (DUF1002 family)